MYIMERVVPTNVGFIISRSTGQFHGVNFPIPPLTFAVTILWLAFLFLAGIDSERAYEWLFSVTLI